ncbi:unnamed protein product [Calypogeia fissa]
MECFLSGNQIKCLNRALTCLAKIGNELLIEAVPDKLILRTLNSSRSCFLSITFKVQFFDAYHVNERRAQCSVLLKSACTVFRTSPANIDCLSISLANQDASKLLWTLDCPNGVRKTYGICCNSVDELHDIAVDRNTMPSHLVVKPRDLTRLLSHFQSSLQEITFILTEPLSTPTDSESTEAKAVEMRSYIDPTSDATDTALHTQLWIDPTEELVEYSHSGVAADVTFSVKELKAFVGFCEGSEVDMHMHVQKAGYPVLIAPRFGLDDAAHADFDATLVLATCHSSQIRASENSEQVGSGYSVGHNGRTGQNSSQRSAQRNLGSRASTPASFRDSERTVVWSELSGSAERVSENQSRVARRESVQLANSLDASEEIPFQLQRQNRNLASGNSTPTGGSIPPETSNRATTAPQGGLPTRSVPVPSGASTPGTHIASVSPQAPPAETRPMTQDHASILAKNLSNWVSGDIEDDDDDTAEEDFCVESTPPHRRGLY